MNYIYFLLDLIITIFSYMFIPFCMFFKRSQNYTINYKQKFLIINSIIIAIGFIILRNILLPNENPVISFVPALLFYYVNYKIWTRNNLDEIPEEKKGKKISKSLKKLNFNKNNTNKTLIITFSSIIILTIIIGGFITINTYLKEESNKEQNILKLEKQEKQEKERQENLSNCINRANISRTNLWNNNCDIQANGSCTIPNNSGTIEWIDQRYQQDLNNCYQLYGK